MGSQSRRRLETCWASCGDRLVSKRVCALSGAPTHLAPDPKDIAGSVLERRLVEARPHQHTFCRVCRSTAKRSRAKPGRSRTNKSQLSIGQNIRVLKRSRAKPGRSRDAHPLFSTLISQNRCSAPPPIYITNKAWGGAGDPSRGSKRNEPSRILEGGACRPRSGFIYMTPEFLGKGRSRK